MAVTLVNATAFTTVVGAGTCTPALPTGRAALDLELFFSGCYSGSATIADPASFGRMSDDVSDKQSPLFARIAQNGDAAPSVDWGATQYGAMAAFRGVTWPAIGSQPHAHNSKAANSANQVALPSLGVLVDNCLIICGGRRFKTSTADSKSFTTLPSGFTKLAESIPAGNFRLAAVWGYKLQTVATNLTLDQYILNVTDTVDNSQGFAVAFLTTAAGKLISIDLNARFKELTGRFR